VVLAPATASGRKQPLKQTGFDEIECPLRVKAGVPPATSEIGSPNGRFAPWSSDHDLFAGDRYTYDFFWDHTVSVGAMPIEGVSLERSYEAVLTGMKDGHAGLEITMEPYETSLGGQDALHFKFEWPSKTTLVVKQDVRLVKKRQQIFSVAIRPNVQR
jgi:hypothetical protein